MGKENKHRIAIQSVHRVNLTHFLDSIKDELVIEDIKMKEENSFITFDECDPSYYQTTMYTIKEGEICIFSTEETRNALKEIIEQEG